HRQKDSASQGTSRANDQIVRRRFFKQDHVIVFPAAYIADRNVIPFLIRKNRRNVLAFHVHRTAFHTVDRAVVDDSFEVKALHYWIVLLSMVIPGSKTQAACRSFRTACLPRSGHRFQDRKSTRLNSSHVKISYAV